MIKLSGPDINRIVYRYIGVSGGYLGDFSYKTHAEFYPLYCDLSIDPDQYEGTTRERFIRILSEASPNDQAKILLGILERFPISDEQKPHTRTEELYQELHDIAIRLKSSSPVASFAPKFTSKVVETAINDAEVLINTNGAVSGVDRIHTTLHGYLREICDRESIQYNNDDTITRLFKLLRQNHAIFQGNGNNL